jgi:predicted thioesterase
MMIFIGGNLYPFFQTEKAHYYCPDAEKISALRNNGAAKTLFRKTKTTDIMIEKGIKGRLEQMVTPEMSAARIGSGLVEVFATPMMIALMERTCNESVVPQLEPGQGTVGTLINVTHSAATPIGMKVWCESELIEVDRRRLVFRVRAFDSRGPIGEGLHERFIIDTKRFMQKAMGQV